MKITCNGVRILEIELTTKSAWAASSRHGAGYGSTLEGAIQQCALGHRYQVAKHGLEEDEENQ